MDWAIPRGFIRKSTFPQGFSYILTYYIWKKNYIHRWHKKNRSKYYYCKFSYYQKPVKIKIKSDKLNWYKSVDKDLKTKPTKFWKYVSSFKGKGKAVPLQAWSGPEGSRKLRFPDCMTTAQDDGKVVSLTHRLTLPPENSPGTHFCYRLSRPQGHSVIRRITSMKNSSDTIWNWTSNLPIYSTVP
jgi:hypothetical protein